MSTKKSAAVRRPVRTAAQVAGGEQTAAARREAESQLRTLISKFASAHARLVGTLRRSLLKRLPTSHELVYEYRDFVVISYSPSEHGYEGVLAIHAGADGVKLYFNRGKELPDPEKLLHGSSQARFIDVAGASTLTRPTVASLIAEAISRNRVPFAGSGRGSLVIRETSAKRRRSAK